MIDLWLPDAAATHALGARLGAAVGPDSVLALAGPMGAGKTALVRGLAAGLGCASRVQSPTFVLAMRHEGRLALVHADAWRLGEAAELLELELWEEARGGVLALEWSERFPELLPPDRLEIRLAPEGEGRRASVHATGPAHASLERAAVDG